MDDLFFIKRTSTGQAMNGVRYNSKNCKSGEQFSKARMSKDYGSMMGDKAYADTAASSS